MTASPPISPEGRPRPRSAFVKPAPPRSNSRMSTSSKQGGSRASDEEAKTTVQVAVRIRPPLRPSDPGFDLIPQRFQRSMVHTTSSTSLAVTVPQGRKPFVFDRVFGEDVQQDGIWEYISGSVDSFVQGYNVSIMAYGQSGAGKSFTMGTSGPSEQGNQRLMGSHNTYSHTVSQVLNAAGIVPRAASSLFAKLNPSSTSRPASGLRNPSRYSMSSVPSYSSLKPATAQDKAWQLNATYVEIYNDELRDLLIPDTVPPQERQTVAIREDKGRILLTGLRQVSINSVEDLLGALNFGSTIRQTDATAINAKSSRSHAVFSLNLIQRKSKPQETSARDKRLSMPTDSMSGSEVLVTINSKLHFVDLAGSERLKNTGASGDRAREGININAGLHNLGKVISQLSSRNPSTYVAYRDSKLTRLLQDSLGGNAITYMIACVTPAEFHLSETLNTIDYASRARTIQTKPQIQATSDEGDKQAMIERLRAEIQFLRGQISNSEGQNYHVSVAQGRTDRQSGREIDLQNRLLDVEENYSALSQRHAKLISEMTRGREGEAQNMSLPNGTAGESAVDRLKRSTSFAEAAEQVALEYEKTIQSLESSLSKTRSSLSSTESELRERETKHAYVETINQQLQNRMQKIIDRESSTERYVHDLEAKWDGHMAGEERDSAMLTDLRREMSRLRESSNTQEDYITALEEKLADADQSTEEMQREISRLETVVERQRSVGRLDNLLHELDHGSSRSVNTAGNKPTLDPLPPMANFAASRSKNTKLTDEVLKEAANTPLPTLDEENDEEETDDDETPKRDTTVSHDAAQLDFLQEKLEVVNQELFDLRADHDAMSSDYDLLSAKYEEALRTLAAFQDAVDESRREPPSPIPFLSEVEANQTRPPDGNHTSSRSLSSELSLAGQLPDSTGSTESSESTAVTPSTPQKPFQPNHSIPPPRVVDHALAVRGVGQDGYIDTSEFDTLQQKYQDLFDQHQDTLDLVEELKAEVQKSRLSAPASPNLIRRKSSQNILHSDRTHRSLASLENIAAENFLQSPDVKESFELSLNSLAHELHQRNARVKSLEAEIVAAKKEMDTKMTIISGLTRERSSLKSSSPVEMSMMSSMRDQLLQTEHQFKSLQEAHATREQELLEEVQSLKETLVQSRDELDAPTRSMPGALPETPADAGAEKSLAASREAHEARITELQAQVAHWEDKHKVLGQSMQSTEKRLLATVSELEDTLTHVESLRKSKTAELESLTNSTAAAAAAFELEISKHEESMRSMSKELEKRKEIMGRQATKLAELEKAYARANEDIILGNQFKETTLKALDDHRDQISSLQQEITEHQAALEFHKHGLIRLHDAHAVDIEARRESVRKHAQDENVVLVAELGARHKEETSKLASKIQDLEKRLQDRQTKLDDQARMFEERAAIIGKLEKENQNHVRSTSLATDELKEAKTRLALAQEAQSRAKEDLAGAQSRVEELQWAKNELSSDLEEVREKEQRASRLVEELESQLHNTFEEGRSKNNRLSQLQNARDQELAEARTAMTKAQDEVTTLRNRIENIEGSHGRASPMLVNGERSSSINSFRKPAHAIALPSPPPNMPLPPIPMSSSPKEGRASPSGSGQRNSMQAQLEEKDAKIKQMEKHLKAEKQLVVTLEEALLDIETQVARSKKEMDGWKQKAWSHEDELNSLRQERQANRQSLQAVEEAKIKQREAEAARAHLEERMLALSKKKKKSTLNCF